MMAIVLSGRTPIPVRCPNLSPLFAILTKTVGCVPKIPNLELSAVRSPTLSPTATPHPVSPLDATVRLNPLDATYKKQGGGGCYC